LADACAMLLNVSQPPLCDFCSGSHKPSNVTLWSRRLDRNQALRARDLAIGSGRTHDREYWIARSSRAMTAIGSAVRDGAI
jgi:hypothetical protein